MSVKSFYLIFGSEKFQNIINDWFKLNKDNETYEDISNVNKTDSQVELFLNNINNIKEDNSILNILEQVILF
jgi:hypothetical protein